MKNSAKDKLFSVYVHIAPNGKRYYGITSREPHRRWGNGNGYRQNRHFYNAIKAYGWSNFQHDIIAEKMSLESACQLEQNLIKQYRTDDPKYGYNHTKGGETSVELSDDCRRRMSKSAKKRGLSENLLKYIHNMPPKAGNPIHYDNRIFISRAACARYLGIGTRTLDGMLQGIDSMPKEYKIKGLSYVDVPHTYILSNKVRYKKVEYQGVVYPSYAALDRALGVRKDTISEILGGRMKAPDWLDIDSLHLVENNRYYYKILSTEDNI